MFKVYGLVASAALFLSSVALAQSTMDLEGEDLTTPPEMVSSDDVDFQEDVEGDSSSLKFMMSDDFEQDSTVDVVDDDTEEAEQTDSFDPMMDEEGDDYPLQD